MLKLFAVLLGGRAEGCNTELHDVVFTAAASLEEAYPKLVKKWFGITKHLHIDSSIELKYIDGHEVFLSQGRSKNNNGKKLFFVNFGAYRKGHFGEVHESRFYVAASKAEVLARAKTELCVGLLEAHCDDSYDIDDVIAIDGVEDCHIHLEATSVPSEIVVNSVYRQLDLPEIMEKTAAG